MTPYPDALSDRERLELSRLLPYWGLAIDDKINRFKGTLSGKTISVFGLSVIHHNELDKLLQHTGINLHSVSNKKEAQFVIKINKTTSAPITLQTDKLTYYLKPLRKQTNDVQTWIHKRLWLPVHKGSLSLTFHAGEEKHVPEWLSYLILQFFRQSSFQPLSNMSYSTYNQWVHNVLKPLNSNLAEYQLSLQEATQQQWPQLPPEQKSAKHAINPFHYRKPPTSNEETNDPINPFRDHTPKEQSTINPFRKKPKR